MEKSLKVTIFHNPRCTKSRQTLALLRERGIEPEIVEYLTAPPDEPALHDLLGKLGLSAQQLVRPKEHRELGLAPSTDEDELVRRMAAHPRIIQRPIVVCGDRAAVGRPPEDVLAIL